MTQRYVAIRLKVPDNTAYTALVALRRLGVDVGRVERAAIVAAEDGDDRAALERVRRDEELFNPNLHEVEIRYDLPRRGELLIGEVPSTSLALRARYAQDDRGGRTPLPQDDRVVKTLWRLFDDRGKPVTRAVLERARDALLCNPAIEEAELPCDDAELPSDDAGLPA